MSFQHGGQLEKIKQDYPDQALPWIDLSTGINPFSYPVTPNAESNCHYMMASQSLPQHHDQLTEAAASYYGTDKLLVTPGSMWGIQNLPLMRRLLFPNDARPVLLPKQGFNEHKKAWLAWGFEIEFYEDQPTLTQLSSVQACIVINPNNPTGHLFDPSILRDMHATLINDNACLIIDEAFLDVTPEFSMACENNMQGLIILKSFGKFFGLPGLRVGALIAQSDILELANKLLNPWSIPSLAQQVAIDAWTDKAWQKMCTKNINACGNKLKELLLELAYDSQGTDFFQTHYSDDAKALYDFLLTKGIYTRLLDDESGLRFGLPKSESQWIRLENALLGFKHTQQPESHIFDTHFKKAEPA